jgi:beta-galactosidase
MKRRTMLSLLGGSLTSAAVGKAAEAKFPLKLPTATSNEESALPENGARSLNDGWRFHLGDIASTEVHGHNETYLSTKAGAARDAAGVTFQDDNWRLVNLPHDWAIEGAAVPTENVSQGYRRRGFAWYRRQFQLEESARGRYLELQFGGIATNATVWFNGNIVSHSWSGYTSIYIDITSMAEFGDKLNTIAVRVDAKEREGWWYEGAGIYRDVWLIERSAVSIITDGVYANPKRDSDGSWYIPIEVSVANIGERPRDIKVVTELTDARGSIVGSAATAVVAKSLDHTVARLRVNVSTPQLWSITSPYLYDVKTSVLDGKKVVDERSTKCGFRTIRFDADNGFFLNEKSLKIKGVCIHQDHGGVGVAVPRALIYWRIRRLKELGCNAIRSAHHAPNTGLLDACDALGMLVLNENRLFNVSPDYVDQLTWMVRRDRNRPSVFLWSVFNEEPIQATPSGYEMVRRMASTVKALDDTRPVTAAMNGGMFTPLNVSDAVDVMGFNYQQTDYDRFHRENPQQPIISSEDTAALMTRGAWLTDDSKHMFASYDDEKASFGDTQRNTWKQIDQRKYIAGGFAWTGFDYHGEPQPHEWPSKSSYFGIMDLCGFPKTDYYIRQAMWIKDRPIAHLAPHWNWHGREGKNIKVMAITNGDSVRINLNGKPVAQGNVDPYEMATFEIPFTPGKLEMIVYKEGQLYASTVVETTGAAVALRLVADRRVLIGDGRDAQPVRVEAIDSSGRVVPDSNAALRYEVTGGQIIGLTNGDPTGPQSSKGISDLLFNGLAQIIIQTDQESTDVLRLVAHSPNLKPAVLMISILQGSLPTMSAIKPRH